MGSCYTGSYNTHTRCTLYQMCLYYDVVYVTYRSWLLLPSDDVGVVAVEADGVQQHTSHSKQGVPADDGAAGGH